MPEATAYAARLDRDVVEAAGEESAAFLQGQLSQDVLGMADGTSAWSWVLSPQGKIDALVRVTRLSSQRWVLDTDRGWGEALVARLNRFKLRTKITIEARDWDVVAVRGSAEIATAAPVVRADPAWPGVEGVDLIGEGLPLPAGMREAGAAEIEAERIRLGMPRMGKELDERTIPGETGLVARTASFTKGCYTGQELVARVDARGGNVPRRLARLVPVAQVAEGTALVSGASGAPAATVTSVAEQPGGGWVALGYLKRGVDPEGSLSSEGGGIAVAVEGLVG